jgi:hypothetical protein
MIFYNDNTEIVSLLQYFYDNSMVIEDIDHLKH